MLIYIKQGDMFIQDQKYEFWTHALKDIKTFWSMVVSLRSNI